MSDIQFAVDETALSKISNFALDANFDEVKSALTEMVEPYKNLIVTEDAIGSAKADRAKINKVATNIDDYRKTIKSIYNQPYLAFEEKCKELVAIAKEASNNLDAQVKHFEELKKQEKHEELLNYFNENVGDMAEFIDFSSIDNPKWMNATFKIDDAKSAIENAIITTRHEVMTLKKLNSPFEVALMDCYIADRSLYKALDLNERLMAKAEADKKTDYENARYADAQGVSPEITESPVIITEPEVPVAEDTPFVIQEEVYSADIRIWATSSQMYALRDWLNANGIKYGKVE